MVSTSSMREPPSSADAAGTGQLCCALDSASGLSAETRIGDGFEVRREQLDEDGS
jgi:hypothetical protein